MKEVVSSLKNNQHKDEEPLTITINITDTNGHPRKSESKNWWKRTYVMNRPSKEASRHNVHLPTKRTCVMNRPSPRS